jgi:hypothetical protein
MTDFRTPPAREPGPQPDPMLKPGPRGPGWLWLLGLAAVAIVAVTLYGINNQEPQTAANEPAATQAQSAEGETTGAAPNEQQSDSDKRPAGPANSPNNTAPQKDQSGQTNQKPQQ